MTTDEIKTQILSTAADMVETAKLAERVRIVEWMRDLARHHYDSQAKADLFYWAARIDEMAHWTWDGVSR